MDPRCSAPSTLYAHTMGIIVSTAAANWDNLGPDLLVGVATGVGVGLVLLGAQALAQWFKKRADTRYAWESFKPQIAGAAHLNWNKDIVSLTPGPAALVALHALAAGQPLSQWKRHLPEPDDTLEILLGIALQRATFDAAAGEVERNARLETSQIALSAFEQEALRQRVLARALGLSDSELKSQSALFAHADLTIYSSVLEDLVTKPGLAAALAMYESCSVLYLVSIATLLAQLQMDWSRQVKLLEASQPAAN
jgi:hypothetical protein